jgi:hypothetical protein
MKYIKEYELFCLNLVPVAQLAEHLTVGHVIFPPLDRAAGCLPLLIISYNGFTPSDQIDAEVMQMDS